MLLIKGTWRTAFQHHSPIFSPFPFLHSKGWTTLAPVEKQREGHQELFTYCCLFYIKFSSFRTWPWLVSQARTERGNSSSISIQITFVLHWIIVPPFYSRAKGDWLKGDYLLLIACITEQDLGITFVILPHTLMLLLLLILLFKTYFSPVMWRQWLLLPREMVKRLPDTIKQEEPSASRRSFP